MTGPAFGKIPLKAKVLLKGSAIAAKVYVHVKGYALAHVTHLDIESSKLQLMKGKGNFLDIVGIKGGLEIPHFGITIISPALNKVLRAGERTRTWVGQKVGGIYIGFRKSEVEKLEGIARRKFNFKK